MSHVKDAVYVLGKIHIFYMRCRFGKEKFSHIFNRQYIFKSIMSHVENTTLGWQLRK